MLATSGTQLAEPPSNADRPAPRLVADTVTRVATALSGLSAEEMRMVVSRVEEIYRLRGWKDGPLNLSRHHLERLERKLTACSYAIGQ
ncbi:MAG: hypothetical protein KGI89_16515, partial [Euryarchaeota archaeon]|nr:hypothetical protein [Euryarchaeota archaeon]